MQNLNSTHKRNILIATAISAVMALMVFKTTNAQTDTKSVAWYVSNIRDAQAKNNECRAENNTELQATPECVNALHALEISFK